MIQNTYVPRDHGARSRALQWLYIVAILLTLSACGVGGAAGGDTSTSGNNNSSNPPPDNNTTVDDVALFEQTLFPLLRDSNNFCVSCHGANQIPTFAVADVTTAYNILTSQQKVDLNNPQLSRVYQRPKIDRHICGGDASCDRVAADFLAAIQNWKQQREAAQQTTPPGGGGAVAAAKSATTSFAEAVDGGTARVEDHVIAKYVFDEGSGDVAMDSSGVGTPMNLQLSGTEWVDGGGLRNVSGKAQASLADSQKLLDMIVPTGQFTVEAWAIAENTTQDGPARMVSYSIDTTNRNFTLGQNAIYWLLRNRTDGSSNNGTPNLEALDPQVDTVLQHIVGTFDENVGRKVYINGALAIEDNQPDTLRWSNDRIFVLGNEITDNRLWKGVLKLVEIHNAALTDAEVLQNYQAGTGNIKTLRFDVADAVGSPAYIEMQASQLDSAAYVFANPTFVSDATGVQVKNIRIAVNDSVPVADQAFRRVDTTVAQSGQVLSPLGSVIPVAMGPDLDQFHLEFQVIGNAVGQAEPPVPSSPPAPVPDVPEPDLGVRTFSQINDSMSSLTGIDANNSNVADSFSTLRDSLPSTSDLLSFSAAQQIAIQKLATTYCGEIVNDTTQCSNFFGQCQINGNAKDQVATTLYDKLIGTNIATQPASADVTTEVVRMIDDLGCTNGCTGTEAQTVLNATCAAVLSSGAVTIN